MPVRLTAALLLVVALPGASPLTSLTVDVDGVRSGRGVLRLCLTADPANFPGCIDDAHAITRTVPAGQREIVFSAIARGTYALAVIHDANDNARLDTFAGIPREGFGFSRNPPIGFGAPRFSAAGFALEGAEKQQVRMRYIF